jgi:hypothetical protein
VSVSLKHYATKRLSRRMVACWDSAMEPQLAENRSELLTRADILIDGLEMLLPQDTPAKRQLQREAIQFVQKAISVAHGALVLEGKE